MEYISQETLHDFCRACLKELKEREKCMINGLNLQIRRWLLDATLDDPLENDTYSCNICKLCRHKLEELLEFLNMCERSRTTVLAILEMKKQNIKSTETVSDNYEEKVDLEKNQDWLDFEFNVSNEIETTTCEKKEYVIDKLEISLEEEVLKIDPESGSEYELQDNDKNKSSDSDSDFETTKTKTRTKNLNKPKGDKTKPKTKSSSTTKKAQVTCDECGRRCLNQQTLENHKRTHLGLRPFQCPQCDRSYNKANHLNEHINVSHSQEEVNIICDFEGCGKHFQRTRTYKTHFRLKHSAVVQIQQKHICEDCGKSYTNLGSLKQHQYTHKTKDKYPFKCTDCDKAFTTQRAFNEHRLRHAGIKNYECPHCGMKKTTKNELRTHMNYHTKEKQYKCPRCPMVFNNTGNLRTHDRIVHQGIRRYSCRFCEESFGKPDSLKHHEMRHTGEKPHVCTECGKRFIQKVALKAHMKTHNSKICTNNKI